MTNKTETDKITELAIRLSNSEPFVVRKSPVLLYWPQHTIEKEGQWSLSELKMLDIYLALIDRNDESTKNVQIALSQLKELLNVNYTLKLDRVMKLTNSLSTKIIQCKDNIYAGRSKMGIMDCVHDAIIFKTAKTYRDKYGEWVVELETSKDVENIFFTTNVDYGFVEYDLSETVSMKSKNSFNLYMFLQYLSSDLDAFTEDLQKSWVIPLEQLKEQCYKLFGYFNGEYKDFRVFNHEVLSKSVTEVNEKTSFSVKAELVKAGRKVVAVRFIPQNKSRKFTARLATRT